MLANSQSVTTLYRSDWFLARSFLARAFSSPGQEDRVHWATRARTALDRALTYEPVAAMMLWTRADLEWRFFDPGLARQFEAQAAAVADWSQAAEFGRYFANVCFAIPDQAFRERQAERAMHLLRYAVSRSTGEARFEGRMTLGYVLQQLSRFEEARGVFAQAAAEAPPWSVWQVEAAATDVSLYLGDAAGARRHLEAAIAGAPEEKRRALTALRERLFPGGEGR